MANAAFSPRDYRVAVRAESTNGTDAGIGSSISYLDVDSIGFPSLNLNQVLEPRNGSRVLQATDFFQDKLNKVIEVSVSGTATTEVLDLLLGNITQGDTVPYLITSVGAVQNMSSATSNQTANQLLSIAYKSPASGHAIGLKDCFCTAISFNADAGTEGGRIKFSATFKTGSLPTLNQSDIGIDTAISQNNYFMRDWVSAQRVLAGITGVLVNNFTLNIENDVIFCSGPSGSGKSYIAAGIASDHLHREEIDQVLISRPLVCTGKEIGSLPGDLLEKIAPYLLPMMLGLHSDSRRV